MPDDFCRPNFRNHPTQERDEVTSFRIIGADLGRRGEAPQDRIQLLESFALVSSDGRELPVQGKPSGSRRILAVQVAVDQDDQRALPDVVLPLLTHCHAARARRDVVDTARRKGDVVDGRGLGRAAQDVHDREAPRAHAKNERRDRARRHRRADPAKDTGFAQEERALACEGAPTQVEDDQPPCRGTSKRRHGDAEEQDPVPEIRRSAPNQDSQCADEAKQRHGEEDQATVLRPPAHLRRLRWAVEPRGQAQPAAVVPVQHEIVAQALQTFVCVPPIISLNELDDVLLPHVSRVAPIVRPQSLAKAPSREGRREEENRGDEDAGETRERPPEPRSIPEQGPCG